MSVNPILEELKKRGYQVDQNSAYRIGNASGYRSAAVPYVKSYSDLLNERLQLGLQYAQQGPEYKKDLADSISPGGAMTSYKQGDISAFDWDTLKQAEMDRVAANTFYRSVGAFDNTDYAFNKGYVHLTSTDYLKSLLPSLEATRTAWNSGGEEDYLSFIQRNSAVKNKLADMDAQGRNYYDTDALTEADLLWFDQIINGNERWRPNYASQEDVDRYNSLVDQWASVEDWENFDLAQYLGIEAPKAYDESNYKTIISELERRAALETMQADIRSNANYSSLSVYSDPGITPKNVSWAADREYEAYVKGYDDLSRFINSGAVWSELMTAADHNATVREYMSKGYDYISADELADYNALINAGRTEEATQYLELLLPELQYRRAMVLKEYQSVKATNPWLAAPTWVEAGLQGIANVFYLPQQIYETATGKDNPWSSAWDAYNKQQWTGEAQIGAINDADIPDWLKTVATYGYHGVTGFRDNTMRILAGGGSPTASLIIAGLQSGSGSLHESSKRDDMSGAAKIIKAIGTAAIEMGTEKVGLDALFSKGKNGALAYMKKVILSEVGEEVLNAASEPVLEAVVAFLFDHEADIMSGPEFWKNLTDTAITTAISSVFMGGGGAISNEVGTRSIGRDVTKNGDLEGVLRIADSYSNKSEVSEPAKKIRDKQAKGFKVSNRDVGELVTAVSSAIGEKNSKAVTDVLVESVEGRLEELGEEPANAKKLAESISNIYLGKKLTPAERAALKWSDNASQVFKELNSTETVSKEVVPGSIAGTEGQLEDGQYVAGDALASEKNRVGHSWKTAADEKIAAAQRDAFMETARLNEALNTKTSTTTAVGKARDKAKNLMKGKPKMATREVMAEGSDGKEVKGTFERVERENGKLLMVMKDASDAEVKVDADKITNGGDEGILTIINYAQEGARHDMSADEVNTMVNTYLHEGGDVDSFVQQFQENYLSGYSGVNAPAGTISSGIASIAYEQGKAEAIKDETDRVARAQKARKVETPAVGWLGDVTSDTSIKGLGDTDGLNEAVKNMTATQQAMVEFGRHLAETAKINIAFFASKAGADGKYTTQNGSYDPNTHTIYLDINSGASTESGRQDLMKSGTLGAAIGRVAGHELTHVLEATSPEYYGKYKQAVKAALKAKNLDYASLVREKIDAALANGNKLTYAGAEAEVIADASEYMLQDSKFVKNMDQGLKGKVKEIVQKFLNKVNEAIRALTGGHIESAVLRTMTDGVAHYEKQLQDLWDMAFDEMLGAEVRTDTEAEAEELSDTKTKFSIREEAPPKKTGIAYKVFFEKDGKLYPPMVANPGGAGTPVGVWLNADIGASAPPSKTGRPQVQAGGKGTNASKMSLAFRPGWHLGDIPKATQFDRLNRATGVKELFPYNFVWAECEYAMDVDYQEEAMSYGYNANGKFQHSLAGLPRLPVDGYYHYRTNPNPNTVPWVITGAMKVNRVLSRHEVDDILREKGVEPTKWQGPNGEQMEVGGEEKVQYSPRGVETEEKTSIKDQIRAIQNKLNSMDVVSSVYAPNFNGVKEQERKKWILNILKPSGFKVDIQGFGVVEFGENQINNSLNYLDDPEEIAAFACIPRVLKRGIATDGHENHKNRRYSTVTFAAPVEINGTRGNMAVVVKQTGKNLYKTHRILMPDGSAFVFNDNEKTEPKPAGGIPSQGKAQATHISSADYIVQEPDKNVKQKIQESTRDDDTTHPMQRQFSVRQLAESLGYELKMLEGTDVPYAIVDSNGRDVTSFTADQIKSTPLGGLIDAAVSAGNIDAHAQQEQLKMIADLATLAAQYKDQAMVWEIAGSQLYSAIKNNSDKQYNKTVDFGTICSKTQAVVDVLSETMLKLDRGLTREEVITAYNKTAKNGLSVPCGPCYVFSRWMGVPGLLNSMANYQSRFGGMTAEEVTAYIDGVQARYSSDGERFSKVIGKQKTKLENRLESIASRMQKAMATGSDMTALFREADEVEREYADVEAYNWVTQVLCQSKRVKGAIEVLRDADGIVKLDPSYKPVPHSILFDMRRTGEFAKYPKSWKYRSTRGAGMGKSILPYSGAGLGDTVYGEQKRRTASQNVFLNPNMTKAQRVRAIKNATKRMKSQNLIGGHRFQSTSDYRPEWGLDYIMTFLEMQAVGAKGQLYTKVIEAVDMFATAGIEVNLSIMANGDGWHYDKNGNPVLGVEDFSSVSGIDFSEALKKAREYDNVQMILVGMNDTHIRLALADDRITFVIPWHSSGSSESILKQLFDAVGEELHTGSDYQEIQSDKPVPRPTEEQKRNMTLRTKIITGKFAKVLPTETEREAIEANEFLNDLYTRFYLDPSATDTYGVKLSSEQASQVFPYEYWDTSLTYENADENGRRFVRYCESIGLVPRFEKFKDDHGYWKLLIDRRMYNRDGSYHTPEVIDVTGVEIGDIASAVSQAKYGDPVKTGNAVMETIEELRTKAGSPSYPEPSITNTMEDYGDEVEVDPRPIQQSIRDLPEDTVTYRDYLTEADSSIAATIEERNALSIYQKLLKNHAEASEKVIEAEAALAAADETHKPEARKALAAARVKQKDLYNRLLNVERTAHVQTLVKRSNQIIGDLYGKDQAELDKMLADKERRIASLKADLTGLKGAARTQREADIREQEREVAALKSKATKALLANSERYQQQIADIRLRRDINIEIGKRTRHIKRIVKQLNDRIIHEEDYKNVKEPLKPVVHKLVQTFIDGFGNMVFDQKTADRLRSVYDEIANEDGAPEFYSDDVANWLSELSDMKEWDALIRAEGSSSLGAAEEKLTAYSRVAEIADHIYKLVTAADEIFIDGKREKFNAFSTETGTALIEHKDSKLLVGRARDAYNAFQNLLVKGNLTPQFFFEHLKNSGMTRLFDGLMRGQTEYAQAIREGQEAISDAKKRYNFYAWQNMKEGVQFHTEQGHDIALTVPQMMWVYATAKREATNKLMGTHHLDQGGFRYDENNIPRQKGKPWKAAPGGKLLHKLSQADVEKISNTLTAEQKACADELVSYLSNECAAQGNRASMELFGIKKYNEEYYFPFKTASDQRYQRSDAGAASTTNDARVKHTSFTHSLRKGANTPLVMGDFFDVIADHINLMATYSSFVVPIESMNRVMNTKINEEADGSGNDVTIRSLIGRKYGEASQKYIADLLKDLNGGPQTDSRGGLSALFRTFKRGAVMGSLSVTLQQPTAIVRAFAYVNPKYFAHITMEGNKKTWERMMKHSGTAVIKEMGKFDVGTGHMANDWIANSDIQEYNVLKRARFLMKTEGWKAAKDNTIEFLTSLPGVMDRITWTHIWKAVEAEQADQHPGMDRNSDEFLDMVGKRFDDVINHTQVYDSVLAKSQNMRSKNPLTQMSTAFMSEPTLNANLYYSAVTGDHTSGQRAGIVTSVIASNLLAAAMASLISAWNKDDDDRKFTEKYLAAFASRAVDNLNPMTMYPYLSDLWSMVSGYDIERTDMSVVQDIWNYGSTFYKKLAEGEDITWRDRENFYGTIANLFGIPGKNVSRDIRRIRNLITTDKSASSPSAIKYTLYENAIPLGLWKDSNKAYCQRLVAAVADGDKQEAYDLWDYLTNTKKPSQNTINTNIRDELKRRVQEGSLAPEQATEILRKYAPYKNDKDNLNKPKEWAE